MVYTRHCYRDTDRGYYYSFTIRHMLSLFEWEYLLTIVAGDTFLKSVDKFFCRFYNDGHDHSN